MLKKIRFLFARKLSQNRLRQIESIEEDQHPEIKFQYFGEHEKQFQCALMTFQNIPQQDYNLWKNQHYYKGSNLHILATGINCQKTCLDILLQSEKIKANNYILNLCLEDILMTHEEPMTIVSAENIVAKKQLTHFFRKYFFKMDKYIMHQNEPIVLKLFDQEQFITGDTDLTMAYIANLSARSKIQFGKPPNLLFLEDNVMKMDSQLLGSLFIKNVKDFNKHLYESNKQVKLSREFFVQYFHDFVRKNHSDILYDKWMYYSLSIFENCVNISKQNILQVNYHLANNLSKLLQYKK